jgi:hypothetical protein
MGVVAIGGAWRTALVPALNAVMTHQLGDPVDANPPPFSAQGGMHTRTAIDRAIVGMDPANVGLQVMVGRLACTLRTVSPRIVTAGASSTAHMVRTG